MMLAGLLGSAAFPSNAQTHWVGTWGTASFAVNNAPPAASSSTAVVKDLGPIGSSDETLRQIVHLSIGGTAVRIVFSNEYGSTPLVVGAASVAVTAAPGGLRSETLRTLQFGGRPGITIPVGASALSDPVDLKVEPLSDLAVSLFLPAQTLTSLTEHTNAVQTNLRGAGNDVAKVQLESPTPFYGYAFLKTVQVAAPADAAAIVAFGDSITDGAYVTRDSNNRWPDELARRLQADKKTRNLGVLNEGIGGNRVLHDGTGANALARIGRDAFDQPGVRYLILLEAINDIGRAYQTAGAVDVVTASDLISGYEQIIERAHEHGVKVIGATLTPYMGAGYSSPAGEQVRVAVNTWIRGAGHFDGLIDFDAATRDPANPSVFLPAADHGDHLHPGDPGYKMMGDAIDLSLFEK